MTTLGWMIWGLIMTYCLAQEVYFPLVIFAAYLVLKFVFDFISAMVRQEPDLPSAEQYTQQLRDVYIRPDNEASVIDVEVIEMRDRK